MLGLRRTAQGTDKAVSNLNRLLNSIDLDNSAVGLLLTDSIMGDQVKQVFSNLEKSSMDISNMTEKLELVVTDLQNGESTFNYLTKNEKLPKVIDSTMKNIKQASERLNENMEALKHNFFFRSYFRKKEKEAEKEAKKNQ